MIRLHQAEIEELNTSAEQYRAAGASVRNALDQAAADCGLTLIAENHPCRIYGRPDVGVVNAWLEGPQSMEVEPGGAGFDDQTDWYRDSR